MIEIYIYYFLFDGVCILDHFVFQSVSRKNPKEIHKWSKIKRKSPQDKLIIKYFFTNYFPLERFLFFELVLILLPIKTMKNLSFYQLFIFFISLSRISNSYFRFWSLDVGCEFIHLFQKNGIQSCTQSIYRISTHVYDIPDNVKLNFFLKKVKFDLRILKIIINK